MTTPVAGGPLVVVLVGTDHHRFDRLVGWSDDLARRRPDVRVKVQYGSSRAPEQADGVPVLERDELLQWIGRAHVGITHGGPGTINDVRASGLRPIVVPRDPVLGEHVDGHQMRFANYLATQGLVDVARSAGQLVELVEAALGAPRPQPSGPDDARASAAAQRFGRLVDELLRRH